MLDGSPFRRLLATAVVLAFAAPYAVEVVCGFNPGVVQSMEMMDCTPVRDGVRSPGSNQDTCCDMTCCAALAPVAPMATTIRVVASPAERPDRVLPAGTLAPGWVRRPPTPPPKG